VTTGPEIVTLTSTVDGEYVLLEKRPDGSLVVQRVAAYLAARQRPQPGPGEPDKPEQGGGPADAA
jgi:hypothetical protein